MESNFNDRDFERFLKQNADQYRMFPSENVWEGIHKNLHTRRRWQGIVLALLLLTTGTVTWVMFTNPAIKKTAIANSTTTKSEKTQKEKVAIVTPLQSPKEINKTLIASPDNRQKNLFLAVAEIKHEKSVANDELVRSPITVRSGISFTLPPAEAKPLLIAINTKTAVQSLKDKVRNKPAATISPMVVVDQNMMAEIELPAPSISEPAIPKKAEVNEDFATLLTIESVINSYKFNKKSKKLQWQFFVTPTVSYRRLNENKQFIAAARSSLTSTSIGYSPDLNSIITHKPDLGIQLGFSTGYPLSKRITITSGLQFNVSKYDIRAYSYPSEIATIALSTASGGTNTVSAVTNYRNTGGNIANWLRNFYYSASMPIGLEYKITGNKKSYWGVNASIQPTYVVGNRAYVISTDYKNYVEMPSLTRKWNINAGFETFGGFSIGNTDFRVGPQVRYQTLSSYKQLYPVKEHLFDFGLKMGIMLN